MTAGAFIRASSTRLRGEGLSSRGAARRTSGLDAVHAWAASRMGFLRNGDYRAMAGDAGEFRHRDWWKRHRPAVRMLRELRAGSGLNVNNQKR